MRVARSLTPHEVRVEEAPDPERRARRRRRPRAGVRRLRLGRPRQLGRAQGADGPRPRAGGRGHRGRRGGRRRRGRATASSCTTTRRAASAGAAGAGTRRCASASSATAPGPRRLRRAGPRRRPTSSASCSSLDGLDAERATFVEPLACVLRAFDRCGLRAGDSLLVVGCGHQRPAAIAAAHARAVEAVWAREPRPERLERALALGAERHGNELVDVVIVCTPKPAAIAAGFAAVAPGGAPCLYAPPRPGPRARPRRPRALRRRGRRVRVLLGRPRRHARGAGAASPAAQVEPLPFVTHRVGLDDTGRALELARSGEAIKALVLP